ncbi:hypothetical protein KM043_018351 [Ampulex compressa]|nr:hypothetical protein KM043_018351 [Ampulex compressa]
MRSLVSQNVAIIGNKFRFSPPTRFFRRVGRAGGRDSGSAWKKEGPGRQRAQRVGSKSEEGQPPEEAGEAEDRYAGGSACEHRIPHSAATDRKLSGGYRTVLPPLRRAARKSARCFDREGLRPSTGILLARRTKPGRESWAGLDTRDRSRGPGRGGELWITWARKPGVEVVDAEAECRRLGVEVGDLVDLDRKVGRTAAKWRRSECRGTQNKRLELEYIRYQKRCCTTPKQYRLAHECALIRRHNPSIIMRAFLILASIFLQIHLHFIVSQAEQQRAPSGNHQVVALNSAESGDDVPEGPFKDILAQRGSTAILPCKITDPGAGTIIWVRSRDKQLLTIGTSTHSIDGRFSVRHSSIEWTLHIRTVTLQDAGIYECQVTSHPVQRYFVRLNITEAYSIIPGAPDLHVKQGSSLRLECQLVAATESPQYVFWYRQDRMINYDEEPGVKVEFTKTGSILMVNKTKPAHGGNYTCEPSNARPAYVMVHVIEEEEKPAAMHGGDRRNLSPAILASNFLVSLLAAVSWRIPSFTSLYPT